MNKRRQAENNGNQVTHDPHDPEIFRLMVANVKDYAIFMLDPNGDVMTWNEGAERIKGYAANEIIGKNFSTFYTQEARDIKHPQHELDVAEKDGRYEEEGWRVRKDGSLFWASVVITAVRKDGQLAGFAKVTRDLTERKRSELQAANTAAELRQANEELVKANSAKDVFLATMSHELRTPLNSILGFNDVMLMGLSGPLTDTQKKQAGYIKQAAKHLLSLINDILDLAKIESGKMELDTERINLRHMVSEVCCVLEPLAAEKKLYLRTSESVADEPVVRGDDRALRQILMNLVSNAIKFTDAGGITISCRAIGDEVRIDVHDTGIGISEADLPKLFTAFMQLARSNRKQEGTGLGLTLSKRLAELMHGDIKVESQLGQGSTFTLVLPIDAKEAE